MIQAAYWSATKPRRFHVAEKWREDVIALKNLMRRTFQLLKYNEMSGDYAEFGVWGARTFSIAWNAAKLVDYPAHFWAFDSFEGLPASQDPRDQHPGWKPGAMTMSQQRFQHACAKEGMPPDAYSIVPGFYRDSLDEKAPGPRPDRISFAYIDCDLYSSTVDVLRFLGPRLRNGMVIAFDDWFCYTPDGPSGERLAAKEFFDAHPDWNLLPYIQYGWQGMSFIVEPTG